MGVVTVGDQLKSSITGKKPFRTSASSTRHLSDWYFPSS